MSKEQEDEIKRLQQQILSLRREAAKLYTQRDEAEDKSKRLEAEIIEMKQKRDGLRIPLNDEKDYW